MNPAGPGSGRKPNHLIHEKSPYLLQHAYNPVDWYPWGEEAFARARRDDKPIFLSIGYSTCHWCHVMEHESFENESVAALLNEYFVPIKVDREERPDVDRIYMTAMQALHLGGGWPLNVFLTPDRKPFYGGTYFPPTSRPGLPGLLDLLPQVHEAWRTRRAELVENGDHVLRALEAMSAADSQATAGAATAAGRERLFDDCYRGLERTYDEAHGGFGGSPKFPSVVNLNFLLRYWARDPAARGRARAMALGQLDAMRAVGIHDQLGGGFHRYSTDAAWIEPHFEKMLYDQAQLAVAYLEGYQVTGEAACAATARDIFSYVARDLTSSEGAFYSAEDADSEGEEGRFYVWTPREIEAVLPHDEAALFEDAFGVTDGGNFHGGTTILHEAHPLAEAAARHGVTVAEAAERLARARVALLAARSKRVRPHLDDKVITAWNGLMIAAFARGSRVLGDPALARRAEHAASFVWTRLHDARTGELKRRWRDGEAAGAGQLDDYAYLARGYLELYEATLDPLWLERSVGLTEAQIARFWDSRGGGFFESPAGDPSIALRMKDGFDGAEMAGNSIAALDLQTLAVLLDRDDWRDKAERTFDYYAGRLAEYPPAMPQMLVAMDLAAAAPRHVVIAGSPGSADARALVAEFDRRFLPHDFLLFADGAEAQRRLAALAPFVAPLVSAHGHATAYVCVDYACRLPVSEPAAFGALLDERNPRRGDPPGVGTGSASGEP